MYYFIENCEFCYVWQPPTGLNCNPYKNITLQCTIELPTTVELQLKWFREKNNIKTEITSGNSAFSIQQETNTIDIDNNQKASYLTIYTNNIAGEYWCQVFHNDESRLESQHLDVGPESDYDRLDYCSKTQTVEELTTKKCDNIFKMNGASLNCQGASNIPTSTLLTSSSNLYHTIMINSSTMPASPILDQRNSSNQFHTILYIAIGLAGVFIFLIIILSLICVGLCLTQSKSRSKCK